MLLSAAPAMATSQAPDQIIVDGAEVALNTNPLEGYLEGHRDKRPHSNTVSSGLWRGYIAHWSIVDGKLLLYKVEVLDDSKHDGGWTFKDVTAQYFPEAPVPADWYTGALVIPRGQLVKYVHMGYASEFESYTIFVVRNGTIADRKDLSLEEFEAYRKRKFERFKATPEYSRQFKKAAKDFGSKSMAEKFLAEFYTEQYLAAAE